MLEFGLKSVLCTIILILLLTLPKSVSAAQGPFPAANSLPINRLFLNPVFEMPEVLGRGSAQGNISIDYGSVNVDKQSDNWDVLMDMEFAVISLWFKIGLPLHTEGAVLLPLLYYYDGFLDGFLEWYHESLDLPDYYGREDRPPNEYGYRVRKNGKDWFSPTKDGCSGVEDTQISLKKGLLAHGDTRLSIKGVLKLPTGNSNRGLGSGHVDLGIMLLFGQRLRNWRLHLGAARTWLGAPDTYGDINPEISDTTSASFAVEYMWSDRLSLLGQMEARTSPFSSTGIKALDRDCLGVTLGAKYRLSDAVGTELAFSEDLTAAAPDFAIRTALAIDF